MSLLLVSALDREYLLELGWEAEPLVKVRPAEVVSEYSVGLA